MQDSISELFLFGLIFSGRLLPVLFFAPPFSSFPIPNVVKILISSLMGMMLAFTTKSKLPSIEQDILYILSLLSNELLLGLFLSASLLITFSIYHLSGKILDLVVGFGISSLLDNSTKNSISVFGAILNSVAIFMFISFGGMEEIYKLLCSDFLFPVNRVGYEGISDFLAYSGTIFYVAFIVSFPTILVISLVDVLMAIMSKSLPQMNVFFLSISIKPLVAIISVFSSLHYINAMNHRIFSSLFDFWGYVFNG